MSAKALSASMRDFLEERTATYPLVAPAGAAVGASAAGVFLGTGALATGALAGDIGSAAASLAGAAALTGGGWGTALTGGACTGGGSDARAAEGGGPCGPGIGGMPVSSITPGRGITGPDGRGGALAVVAGAAPVGMGMTFTFFGPLGSSLASAGGELAGITTRAGGGGFVPSSPSRLRSFLSVCGTTRPSCVSGLVLLGPKSAALINGARPPLGETRLL